MGLLEDAVHAADSLITSLRRQPLAVAMLIMNGVLLLYMLWHDENVWRDRNKYIGETQALLSRCLTVDEFTKLARELQR